MNVRHNTKHINEECWDKFYATYEQIQLLLIVVNVYPTEIIVFEQLLINANGTFSEKYDKAKNPSNMQFRNVMAITGPHHIYIFPAILVQNKYYHYFD